MIGCLAALALCSSRADAADLPDAKDPPLLQRFAGSEIVGYDVKRFDEYDLQTSTFKGTNLGTRKRTYARPPLHLEGSITRVWYESPGDTTTVELARNYLNDFKAKGFEIVYDSGADPAATSFNGYMIPLVTIRNDRAGYIFGAAPPRSIHVISAKLPRPQGDVYVQVSTVQWNEDDRTFRSKRGAYASVDFIETRAMQQNMVTVNADEMYHSIVASGRVALYGLYFDSDKTEVLPKSEPTLAQVAALLKKEPRLKLRIVGHTDSAGNLDANLALSRRRAESVLARLTRDYAVDPHRLTAHGVSSLAPAASNESDEGRAKNRRVELVPW